MFPEVSKQIELREQNKSRLTTGKIGVDLETIEAAVSSLYQEAAAY